MQDPKKRVKCFERVFNEILDKNATNPERPPMFFKGADDLAVNVMDRMGIVLVVPVIKQFYEEMLSRQDIPAAGGRSRDHMDGGSLDGASRDGGGRDGGKQNKLPLQGKVPGDLRLLKIGGERLCKDYMRGRCSRLKDKNNRGCTGKEGDLTHLCGVAIRVNKNSTVRLCGARMNQRNARKRSKMEASVSI